jgi:hypothetical protein
MNIVIHVIQHNRVVIGIKYRPSCLYLKGTSEFVGGKLLGDVEHHGTLDSLFGCKYMVGPDFIVHEFEHGILQCLKDLLVRSLDLLGNNLDITLKFLAVRLRHRQK